mgnify:CR=1 FL=1
MSVIASLVIETTSQTEDSVQKITELLKFYGIIISYIFGGKMNIFNKNHSNKLIVFHKSKNKKLLIKKLGQEA